MSVYPKRLEVSLVSLVYPSISSYRKKYMIGKSSVIAMSYDADPYGVTIHHSPGKHADTLLIISSSSTTDIKKTSQIWSWNFRIFDRGT